MHGHTADDICRQKAAEGIADRKRKKTLQSGLDSIACILLSTH